MDPWVANVVGYKEMLEVILVHLQHFYHQQETQEALEEQVQLPLALEDQQQNLTALSQSSLLETVPVASM